MAGLSVYGIHDWERESKGVEDMPATGSMHDSPDRYPDHVEFALARLGFPDDDEEDAFITDFRRRWGGFTLEAFLKVLAETIHDGENQARDRLFTLFAAGALSGEQGEAAAQHVLPYLESADGRERWAAAIGRGAQGDQRVVPTLCTMLTEYLPEQLPISLTHDSTYYRSGEGFYEFYREWAPWLLGELGNRKAVPDLREALQRVGVLLGSVTQKLLKQDSEGVDATARNIFRYETALVYTLGRLHAYGALSGMEVMALHSPLWTIHLVLGGLHKRFAPMDMVRWIRQPLLPTEVATFLTEEFGWLPFQQEEAFVRYVKSILMREATGMLWQT